MKKIPKFFHIIHLFFFVFHYQLLCLHSMITQSPFQTRNLNFSLISLVYIQKTFHKIHFVDVVTSKWIIFLTYSVIFCHFFLFFSYFFSIFSYFFYDLMHFTLNFLKLLHVNYYFSSLRHCRTLNCGRKMLAAH